MSTQSIPKPNRKPDYDLAAMNKRTGERNYRCGAAWKNDDGTISIKLDPFIVLDANNPGIVVTLFERKEKPL
jgi:hypothetical protein